MLYRKMAVGLTSVMALFHMVLLAAARYDLRFMLESYSNHEGLCTVQSCAQGCPSFCDYDIYICERPAGTPVSYQTTFKDGNCFGQTIQLEQQMAVGFDITYSGQPWPDDGVQIFVETLDRSEPSSNDRFAINVTNFPVGSTTSNQPYSGIFGNAAINVTLSLVCLDTFQGPRCDIRCLNNSCPCEPGYTGQYCQTEIDNCTGVSCGQNERCTNGVCECEEGFTGMVCEITDRCAGVDCGQNQRCVDEILNYTCVCNPGYTGQDCLTNMTVNMCAPGSTGPDCPANVSTCIDVDCHSHGECSKGACNCKPSFAGEFCETTLVPTGNSIIVPAIVAASILALVTVVTVVIFSVVCIRLRRMSKHKNCRAIRSSNATHEHDCTTSTPDYDYPHVVANGSRVQSEATYEATYEEIRPAFPTPNPSPNHNRNPTTSNDDHTPSNGDHTPSNEEIGARSQDEAHYNIKICPAYSSNNRNPHCTTNPAYAMAKLGGHNPRNTEDPDYHYYY